MRLRLQAIGASINPNTIVWTKGVGLKVLGGRKIFDFWLAILLAACLIILQVFVEGSPVRLLFGNPIEYPNFEFPFKLKTLLVFLILGSILLVGGTQYLIKSIKDDFAAYTKTIDDERADKKLQLLAEDKAKKEAEETRIKLEAIEKEQRRQRLGEKITKSRVSALEVAGYSQLRVSNLSTNSRLLQGKTTATVGELEVSEYRTEVDDLYGNQKAILVFHVFENSAIWNYDSNNSFSRWNGRGVNILTEINKSSSLQKKFQEYDILVGIGLASNSTWLPSDISYERAAFLCGALNTFRKDLGTQVYGLSIGHHEGPEVDSEEKPQKMQRAVAILGVKKKQDNVPVETYLKKISQSLSGSGLDLSKYSLMKRDQEPIWLKIDECSPT